MLQLQLLLLLLLEKKVLRSEAQYLPPSVIDKIPETPPSKKKRKLGLLASDVSMQAYFGCASRHLLIICQSLPDANRTSPLTTTILLGFI
jgi:hypothetical protein